MAVSLGTTAPANISLGDSPALVSLGSTLVWPAKKALTDPLTSAANFVSYEHAPVISGGKFASPSSTPNDQTWRYVGLYNTPAATNDMYVDVQPANRPVQSALGSGALLRANNSYTSGIVFSVLANRLELFKLTAGPTFSSLAYTTGSYGTSDYWAFFAQGFTYTYLRLISGTWQVLWSWTDPSNQIPLGPAYRYGGLYTIAQTSNFGFTKTYSNDWQGFLIGDL